MFWLDPPTEAAARSGDRASVPRLIEALPERAAAT